MNLLHIKDIANKYSRAISTILDIDVIIIDSEYNKIAYTSRNVSNQLPVTRTSVIGEVLTTGKVLIIEDNRKYPICRNCVDSSQCKIQGMISVPIMYNERPVGAVALLVPKNMKTSIFEKVGPAIDFLESMADLLSFRLKNMEDYALLEKTKSERETIINTIEEGLLSLDGRNEVSFCNDQFLKYFNIEEDILGRNAEDIFKNSTISNMILSPKDKIVKSLFLEDKGQSFRGIVSKKNVVVNGAKEGMLLSFRSLRDSHWSYSSVMDRYKSLSFDKLRSSDQCMVQTIEKAKEYAIDGCNVLIGSEDGLEVMEIARSIHNFSDRSKERFVRMDCTGKTYSDLENELFGTDRNPLLGALNLANQGTVLMMNIDECPLYLQKDILDVIKYRKNPRNQVEHEATDIRFIMHTSRDLRELSGKKMFNDELHYRLMENALEIPPLRARKRDLPFIIEGRVRELAIRHGKSELKFSKEALEILAGHTWPGNFSELDKTLETIIFNAEGKTVEENDIMSFGFFRDEEKSCNLEVIEEQLLRQMVSEKMSKEAIAEKMGISRATLYRKLKKQGLQ